MKTLLIKSLVVCLLFLGNNALQAQEPVVITLNVNTAEITRSTINKNSNFGQDPEISNEDFTVEVSLGETIVWQGVSTSSEDDVVQIISIQHESGTRLFNKNRINGSEGVARDKVVQGRGGNVEKYSIIFRIIRNGSVVPGTFKIDPKLVVKQ